MIFMLRCCFCLSSQEQEFRQIYPQMCREKNAKRRGPQTRKFGVILFLDHSQFRKFSTSFKVVNSHKSEDILQIFIQNRLFLLTFSLPAQRREKVLIHYNRSIDHFQMETLIFTHFKCLAASTMITKRHIFLCVIREL